jgi:outer membrane protein assembly factor BamB
MSTHLLSAMSSPCAAPQSVAGQPARPPRVRALLLAALCGVPLLGCVAAPDAASSTEQAANAAAPQYPDGRHRSAPEVWVSNSRGNDVLRFDQAAGRPLGVLVQAGAGGLDDPDAMALGPDGQLYISSGRTPETSAILRFDSRTGAFLDVFASGNGLYRPYGLAFGPDGLLYVSSFRSDELFRFDAHSGAFVDVIARGDGQPGGLNGPNGLTFGPDGKLYISTEGSIAGEFPGLPSELLRLDIATGELSLFLRQPEPSPSSFGFVSLLGIDFGPNCASARPGSCDLFVSDFANDVRRYDARTGELKATLDTNYTGTLPSGNFVGGLSFGVGGQLFVAGFDIAAAGNPGAVLRFDGRSGRARPSAGNPGAQYLAPTATLSRPIGILAVQPTR